jgi:hypothetical protein
VAQSAGNATSAHTQTLAQMTQPAAAQQIDGITVDPGGTLTVDPTATVSVNGTVVVESGGTLTIGPGAEFVPVGSVTVYGTLTIGPHSIFVPNGSVTVGTGSTLALVGQNSILETSGTGASLAVDNSIVTIGTIGVPQGLLVVEGPVTVANGIVSGPYFAVSTTFASAGGAAPAAGMPASASGLGTLIGSLGSPGLAGNAGIQPQLNVDALLDALAYAAD